MVSCQMVFGFCFCCTIYLYRFMINFSTPISSVWISCQLLGRLSCLLGVLRTGTGRVTDTAHCSLVHFWAPHFFAYCQQILFLLLRIHFPLNCRASSTLKMPTAKFLLFLGALLEWSTVFYWLEVVELWLTLRALLALLWEMLLLNLVTEMTLGFFFFFFRKVFLGGRFCVSYPPVRCIATGLIYDAIYCLFLACASCHRHNASRSGSSRRTTSLMSGSLSVRFPFLLSFSLIFFFSYGVPFMPVEQPLSHIFLVAFSLCCWCLWGPNSALVQAHILVVWSTLFYFLASLISFLFSLSHERV